MIIAFIGKYYYLANTLTLLFVLNLIAFIIILIVHDKYYKKYDYYSKYVDIITTYIKREENKWNEFQDTGADFLKNAPYYYQDLDIFGDNSLFQLISICKTQGGREQLCHKLSNRKISKKDLLIDQETIEELSQNPGLIIDISILLDYYNNKKIHLSKEMLKLNNTNKNISRFDITISIICTIACLITLWLTLVNKISIKYFYGVFLFNFLISTMYTYIFRTEFSNMEKYINSFKGINSIINRYISQEYKSKKLEIIKNNMLESLIIKKELNRLDIINSLKNNIISNFILNGLFCINIRLLNLFIYQKNKDLTKIKIVASDIEELESLCSLATIGILFKNKCLPTLEENTIIKFDSLIHPLLGENKCIPNNFESNSGINIITGSNMGGKTSFLRTIGINLILMNSGTYVCAKSFNASYFKIFTSMRVNDDISNGISTFYGELLRIKDMIEYKEKTNMLILIDEIFKGTNYQDRIYGAKEIIKKLNTNNNIVLLTTHDFELCEQKNVTNYHVEEYYENDKIIFDYKIKKGASTTTNARYLMKKLGIIKE